MCFLKVALKKDKKLDLKLLVFFGFDVFAIKPNVITKAIAFKFDAFIVSLVLKLVGLLEIFLANDHQFF